MAECGYLWSYNEDGTSGAHTHVCVLDEDHGPDMRHLCKCGGTNTEIGWTDPPLHEATVTYRREDDMIWLACDCGWKQAVDYYPKLDEVKAVWNRHLAERIVAEGGTGRH